MATWWRQTSDRSKHELQRRWKCGRRQWRDTLLERAARASKQNGADDDSSCLPQFAGKVWQSQAIQAAENEHSEFELDPLWYSQPMQVTEQRCDVVGLSCWTYEPSSGIRHWVETVQTVVAGRILKVEGHSGGSNYFSVKRQKNFWCPPTFQLCPPSFWWNQGHNHQS